MRRAIILTCVVLVIGLCTAAGAKVSYLPNQGPSYDFSSMLTGAYGSLTAPYTAVVADDWVCPNGVPVGGVRWWGSYWTPATPGSYDIYSDMLSGALSGGITGFAIAILPNAPPGGTMPFDHPDYANVLQIWNLPVNLANEAFAFAVTKQASPLLVESVYSYSADLSQATLVYGSPGPFAQQQGVKYWLAIAAYLNDPNKQWGWHETTGHHGSYAVQTLNLTTQPIGWYVPCGGHDMAFELVPVPETGSVVAIATGLVGIAGLAARKRK